LPNLSAQGAPLPFVVILVLVSRAEG